MTITIHPLTTADEPFLQEMLYQAIYIPAGSPPPQRKIIRRPELARYIQDWGQPDDVGFIAIDAQTKQPIGAAWFRLFTSHNPGYGFVNQATPELSIAVLPQYRGQGIGTRLLGRLLNEALRHYPAVSLSVSAGNPAVNLYKQFGFKPIKQDNGSLTMLKTKENTQLSTLNTILNLPRDLGDGLVMRCATPDDIERLAQFNQFIHKDDDDPKDFISNWTRALMQGKFPRTSVHDFILVEDTRAETKIVCTTCLISHVWQYGGVSVPMGQPELVGTHPDYRRRGLVRAIFEVIHQLSDHYGHLVQGITGIPWYYRQFEYEYAMDLDALRMLKAENVPQLKKDQTEATQIRPATEADIPSLVRLSTEFSQDKHVVNTMDEARWRYELTARDFIISYYAIIDAQKNVLGYFGATNGLWDTDIMLIALLVEAHAPLHQIVPMVTRTVKKQGEALAAAKDKKSLKTINVYLGTTHPAYDILEAHLEAAQKPYAWYIRVPDLPAFITQITPALETRLANSVMRGYSGTLKLNFYRDGIKLTFEDGKLTGAEDWQDPGDEKKDKPDGRFPPLVFTQLLFGYRSLAELRYAFPDCSANDNGALLLNALFPKQQSWVM